MVATVGAVLYAFAAWTLFVWGNRISNILSDTEATAADKALDLTVAGGLVVLALAVAVAARTGWQRRRVVTAAAVATFAVWAVRVPLLLAADHEAAFKIVHVALAAVSIALAAAALRHTRQSAPHPSPDTPHRQPA